MSKPLQQKHQLFADEYLISGNGTQSCIKAGYEPKSARTQACRLLAHEGIASYIATRRKEIAEKVQISQERTLLEIARIATVDPRKLFHGDGEYKGQAKKINELDSDVAACISRFKITATKAKTITEIWLHPKGPMLEVLGRHFKIFEDLTPGGQTTNTIDLDKLDKGELKTLLEFKRKILKVV